MKNQGNFQNNHFKTFLVRKIPALGSRSSWIRILFALLDPGPYIDKVLDPDPYIVKVLDPNPNPQHCRYPCISYLLTYFILKNSPKGRNRIPGELGQPCPHLRQLVQAFPFHLRLQRLHLNLTAKTPKIGITEQCTVQIEK